MPMCLQLQTRRKDLENRQQRETEFELPSMTEPYCQCLALAFLRIKNSHTAANTSNLWITQVNKKPQTLAVLTYESAYNL